MSTASQNLTSKYINRVLSIDNNTDSNASVDELITSHLKLVVSICSKYRHMNQADFEELIQCGNLALVKAAHAYDPSIGVQFSGYATKVVTYAIKSYLKEDLKLIKLITTKELSRVYNKIAKYRTGDGRLKPEQVTALAIDANVSEDVVRDCEERIYGVSFTGFGVTSDDDDEQYTEIDIVDEYASPERILATLEYERVIRNMKRGLPTVLNDRERDIIKKRYLHKEQATLGDLAETHKVSIERIRQIESAAIKKIRKSFEKSKICIDFDYV